MQRVFWLIAAILTASLTHTAFVLVIPKFSLERTMARLSTAAGVNTFFILPGEERSMLLPSFPSNSVVGACAFDVETGPVAVDANMPDGFWVLTVYSAKGDVLYALDSNQAGTNSFTVTLSKAPSLIEQLRTKPTEEEISATGWSVQTPVTEGLAVFSQPVTDAARSRSVAALMMKSKCRRS
jgi:uncharacterized membrane protein